MAKTIAVWGSPRSGKTSFATKLARTIYDNYDCKVLCVYTDFETPSLPVLFPSFKAENLYSIGNALSQTDITQEGVVKQIVQLKDKMNIGFLGFKDGDNLHSYPQFDREKIQTMYSVIGTLADYVIIDCSSHIGNPLSRIALQMADTAIRLATPDLSCISWYVSQIPLYTASSFRLDKQIQGVNVPDEKGNRLRHKGSLRQQSGIQKSSCRGCYDRQLLQVYVRNLLLPERALYHNDSKYGSYKRSL